MFSEKQTLLIPGPTPVPPRVLRAMMRPMINHRGEAYERFLSNLNVKLKWVFQTEGDVVVFPSSGTGALEAAIANLLSPGDDVLGVSIGYFGDRFAEIAERFGVNVARLEFPWGQAVDLQVLERVLKRQDERFKIQDSGFRAVLVTHNETSTGVTNPLRDIAQMVRKNAPDALLLVDAVSSLGAIELPMDKWGIDVVIAGSQKGLMTPPGLGLVAFNWRAWQATETARCPRYYWDFRLHKKYLERNQNPYTPALPLLFALDEALTMLSEEGIAQVFARHEQLKNVARCGAREIGLELLAPDDVASNTITAMRLPDGVDGGLLARRLREDYNIIVAGGQGPLRGKLIRIGHVGWVQPVDVTLAVFALGRVMRGEDIKIKK